MEYICVVLVLLVILIFLMFRLLSEKDVLFCLCIIVCRFLWIWVMVLLLMFICGVGGVMVLWNRLGCIVCFDVMCVVIMVSCRGEVSVKFCLILVL